MTFQVLVHLTQNVGVIAQAPKAVLTLHGQTMMVELAG
jgi:hypothetical protein